MWRAGKNMAYYRQLKREVTMKGELCRHCDPTTGAICARTSEEHDTLPWLIKSHSFVSVIEPTRPPRGGKHFEKPPRDSVAAISICPSCFSLTLR